MAFNKHQAPTQLWWAYVHQVAEHRISLIREADKKNLGEQAGLCKTDQEEKSSKAVGCGSIEVKDYGKECHQRVFQRQEMTN